MRARRLDVVDELVEGDEAVVFVGGHVMTLSPLATTALLSVGDAWSEATEVAASLVAKFGDPQSDIDPLAGTHSILQTLAEWDLVELQ